MDTKKNFYYELKKEDLNLSKDVFEKFLNMLKKYFDILETEDSIIIQTSDFYKLYKIDPLIKAINAGFNLEDVFKILSKDYEFLELDIKKAAKGNYAHLKRLKGRVIGEKGKSIRTLKDISGADIIVGERYIYILGDKYSARSAYEGVKDLLLGATHGKVFNKLRKYKKELEDKDKEVYFYAGDQI